VVLALAAVTTAAAPSVITVKSGDTLWDLARAHGTSVSELQRLNGLGGSGTLYAGQSLTVRGAGGGSGSGRAGRRGHAPRGRRRHPQPPRAALRHLDARDRRGQRTALQRAHPDRRHPAHPGAGGGSGSGARAPETTNAGVTIPDRVRSSVAANRATLASRSHPSKAEVQRLVAQIARANGVDPALAQAVAFHESGFQQRVVSPVDAIGVMQVLPSTGRGVSQSIGRQLDLLDVRDNITAGVVLLKQLVRTTGSTDKALAGYYQGLGSVSRRGLLPQTEAYIKNVNALRARFSG
jgi:LysM repeat protein